MYMIRSHNNNDNNNKKIKISGLRLCKAKLAFVKRGCARFCLNVLKYLEKNSMNHINNNNNNKKYNNIKDTDFIPCSGLFLNQCPDILPLFKHRRPFFPFRQSWGHTSRVCCLPLSWARIWSIPLLLLRSPMGTHLLSAPSTCPAGVFLEHLPSFPDHCFVTRGQSSISSLPSSRWKMWPCSGPWKHPDAERAETYILVYAFVHHGQEGKRCLEKCN